MACLRVAIKAPIHELKTILDGSDTSSLRVKNSTRMHGVEGL